MKTTKISPITRKRMVKITPNLVDNDLFIYNGKETKYLHVEKAYIGEKLGMFSLTKKLGKNIHDSERNRKRKNKKKK